MACLLGARRSSSLIVAKTSMSCKIAWKFMPELSPLEYDQCDLVELNDSTSISISFVSCNLPIH